MIKARIYVRPFTSQFFRTEKHTCTLISMKIHLRSGTELYSLIVFNVSRDTYWRRVVLRDYVIRDIRVRAYKSTYTSANSHMYLYVSHKIPSPLRATCVPREASKAIGIIERNREARVLRNIRAHTCTCVCDDVTYVHWSKAALIGKRRNVLNPNNR